MEYKYDLTVTQNYVKRLGRCGISENGISADWSGCGIEFDVRGAGYADVHISTDGNVYFSAYIDGINNEARYHVGGSDESVHIALNGAGSEEISRVRIVKESHIVHGCSDISLISTDGRLLAPPPKSGRYIEFIGDSITCGYGLLFDPKYDEKKSNIAEYCSATDAYAYMCAQKLNADYSITSVSGSRIIGNPCMPELYFADNFRRNKSDIYMPKRIPDVVVVNLGTNDAIRSSDISKFKDGVCNFIRRIRMIYGKADIPVIWCIGMMNNGYDGYIEDAIENILGGKTSDIHVLRMNTDNEGPYRHPGPKGQRSAAHYLADYIESEILGNNYKHNISDNKGS